MYATLAQQNGFGLAFLQRGGGARFAKGIAKPNISCCFG